MTDKLKTAFTNLANAVREKAEINSETLLSLDDMATAISGIPTDLIIKANVKTYTVASGSVKASDFVRFVDSTSVVVADSKSYHLGLAKTAGSAGDTIEVYTIFDSVTSYNITTSLNDIAASSGNPTTIVKGGQTTLTFTLSNSKKYLPSTISVSGASYTWTRSSNNTVGTVVLSNPYSDVSISIVAGMYSLSAPTISLSGNTLNIRNVDRRTEEIRVWCRADGASTASRLHTIYTANNKTSYSVNIGTITEPGTYTLYVHAMADYYYSAYSNDITYVVESAPTEFSGTLYITNSRTTASSVNSDIVYCRDYSGTDDDFLSAIDMYGGGEYIDLNTSSTIFTNNVPMNNTGTLVGVDDSDVIYIGVNNVNAASVEAENCTAKLLISATEGNTYTPAAVYKISNFKPGDAIVSVLYLE
jgi:hypothetical protein